MLPQWQMRGANPDEDVPIEATKAQKWIYEKWQDYWEYVKFIKSRHHRLIVFFMGDITDGVHHQTVQALPNVSDQEELAVEVLKPIASLAEVVYVCQGTEAHVGGNGTSERRVCHELGIKLRQAWLVNVDGVVYDVAHHGRAGKRDWTSSAAAMATEARLEALKHGDPIPRYVFRGHNHVIDDSGEKVEGTRAIATPSWQLPTAFGHRVAAHKTADIGGIIVHPNGFVDFRRARYSGAPGQRTLTKA